MSETQTSLRLDRLELRNFRCFAECELPLHPELTVLVAENAQGKTALLDALALALDSLVAPLAFAKNSHGFSRTDVRRIRNEDQKMIPQTPASFYVDGQVSGSGVRWGRSLSGVGPRARTTTKDLKELKAAARGLESEIAKTAGDAIQAVPIAAFYGTGRLWSEHRFTETRKSKADPTVGRASAFIDCLSSSSSFKSFAAWYEATTMAVRDHSPASYSPEENPVKQLAAVRDAVRAVLEPTGWIAVDWAFATSGDDEFPDEPGCVVVEHDDRGRLPLTILSDGVRNMIAMVADLAHRCVRLNPHLGESAARETPGVLLIDEIDMHLHPRWQQLVIGLLRAAFPKLQMIVSTHSPHVLSTVDARSIRVISLENGQAGLNSPTYQTLGVESADVLAKIMGVDPVPNVEPAKWLSRYKALLQIGKHQSEEGADLHEKLEAHFGSEHPVLTEIETLRRLQDFKESQAIGEEKGGSACTD
jgi:predicted ATP-binding protein involved in virulence